MLNAFGYLSSFEYAGMIGLGLNTYYSTQPFLHVFSVPYCNIVTDYCSPTGGRTEL